MTRFLATAHILLFALLVPVPSSADVSSIKSGLGRVEVSVDSISSTDRASLSCISLHAFDTAHSLAVRLGLVPADLIPEELWRLNFKESFRGSSLQLRSGESALFHTAVMNPPADIYVDLSSFRAPSHLIKTASGDYCSGWSDQLVTTLIHEIGHGLEFILTDGPKSHRLRWHAEGFATWFEREYRRRYLGENVVDETAPDPATVYLLSAGRSDYAAAAQIYDSIIDVIGVNGLREVYSRMASQNSTFERALVEQTGITVPIYLWIARNSTIYFK